MGAFRGSPLGPKGRTQAVAIQSMKQTNTGLVRPDKRLVAHENDIAVLQLVRNYGHVRRSEVAKGVWPMSSPGVALKMAKRTVRRLLENGLLAEKPNSLGGRSLVLSARGVSELRMRGFEAHDGHELSSIGGPHFFHRTLGTRYLIERAAFGNQVYGEYLLSKGWGPIGAGELRERFSKLPDGLAFAPGIERGLDRNLYAADWIEVESSYKPDKELEKIFNIAWKVGTWLNTAETILLDRVVFVYDERQRHENQILASLKRYLEKNQRANRELLGSIIFVRCRINFPLVWQSYQETDCATLLKQLETPNPGIEE